MRQPNILEGTGDSRILETRRVDSWHCEGRGFGLEIGILGFGGVSVVPVVFKGSSKVVCPQL